MTNIEINNVRYLKGIKGKYTKHINYLGYSDILLGGLSEGDKIQKIVSSDVYEYVKDDINLESEGCLVSIDNEVEWLKFKGEDYINADGLLEVELGLKDDYIVTGEIDVNQLKVAKHFRSSLEYENFLTKLKTTIHKKKALKPDHEIKIKLNAKLYFIGDSYIIFDKEVIKEGKELLYITYKGLELELLEEYKKITEHAKGYITSRRVYKIDFGMYVNERGTRQKYVYCGKYQYEKPLGINISKKGAMDIQYRDGDKDGYNLLIGYDDVIGELDYRRVELVTDGELFINYDILLSTVEPNKNITQKIIEDKIAESKYDYKVLIEKGLYNLESKRLEKDMEDSDLLMDLPSRDYRNMSKCKSYSYTIKLHGANYVYVVTEGVSGEDTSLNALYKLAHISKDVEDNEPSIQELLDYNEYTKVIELDERFELGLKRIRNGNQWILNQVKKKVEPKKNIF